MKKLILLCVSSFCGQLLLAQTYPVIKGMTVTPAEPNEDDQVMIVTSVETPYPGHRLSKNHQLTQQDFEVDLFACYYGGTQGPPQTYVDTFYIGALADGYWSVTFKARLSSNAGYCEPVDSSDDAMYVQIDPAPLSVYSAELSPPVLWPNPCNDVLFMDSRDVSAIRIYSVTGEELPETEYRKGQFNTGSFSPGVYTMVIRSGETRYRVKFIKQ